MTAQTLGRFVMKHPETEVNFRSALSNTTAGALADRIRHGQYGSVNNKRQIPNRGTPSDYMISEKDANARFARDDTSQTPVSSSNLRGEDISRAELIEKACSQGFEQDDDVHVAEKMTVVRASAGSGQLQTKSIGAPASTSLLADPGQMTTTSPSDIGSAFKIFFGEGQFPYKSDFDVSDQDTWTLPQAFQGQPVPRISETIEQLIFLEGNWYQQVVAPIELTNALAIKWSTWEFNPHLADVVPELGVNRLVNSRRIENQARFVRRGIGFMLEHGFMLTPEGISHYLMNINQLVQATVETNKFDLIHTLLGSHDQNKRWLIENDLFSGKRVEDVYKRGELFYWDIIKKQKNGLELLDTRITDEMNRWRGEADTWIIHPDIANFLTQIPTEKTDFFIAGAQGPQTLRDGPDAFTTFRGNLVFKTRAYHVDEHEPVDIMRFPTQIGEHHWMTDRYPDCLQDIPYQSCFRDVQIYDEDKDKFTTVTIMQALEHSGRFDKETGEVLTFQRHGFLSKYTAKEQENDVLHYRTRDGRLETAKYFANVKATHLSAKSRLALGETVKQRLSGIRGAEKADILLSSVRTAIDQMESYEWNDTTKTYLDALAGGFGGPLPSTRANRSGNLPLFDLNEYPVGVTGSNSLNDNAQYPTGGLGLPPGFQSWEGIQEIVRVWRLVKNGDLSGTIFENVSRGLVDDLEQFVDFFGQVLRKVKTIFPDSEMLSTKNASSWWQRPTAGTVLFNNVVHKYRVPLWFGNEQGGNAAGAGADDINLKEGTISGFLSYAKPIIEDAAAVIQKSGAAAPAGIARVQGFLDLTGTTVPVADPNTGVIPDGQTLGLLGLNKQNVETWLSSLWNVLYVSMLVGSLQGDDPEVLRAKLSKIESDVVGAFYGSTDALARGVDASSLFSVVKSLSKTKPPKRKGELDLSPFFVVDSDSIKQRATDIFQKLQEIASSSDSSNALADSSIGTGALARTTLLAAPRLLEGLAAAVSEGTSTGWMVSNPVIPDLVISLADLQDQADKTQRGDEERAAPFINYELSDRMSLYDLERMSGNVEFVQIANAVEMFNKMNPGMLHDNISSGMGGQFVGSSVSGNRKSRAHMFAADDDDDDDMEFIGDEADLGVADLARGRRARIDDATASMEASGSLRPSRRGLAQGFSHFFEARESLLSDSARQNFAMLADAETDSWAYIFASVFNYAKVNLQQLRDIISNNILFPFNFILSRPHARYMCDYAIKLKRGTETVSTYQRRGRFEVGDDVNIGAHVGHYRYYSKVVVKKPKNVSIARCIFVADYNGGMNSRFIKKSEYKPHDSQYGDGSLFALMVGYEETEDSSPNVINVSGSIADFRQLYDLSGEDQLHYSSAPFYNTLWGWSVGRSLEVDDPNWKYISEKIAVNHNTLKGTTLHRDFTTKKFTMVDSGLGHWGDEATYNGVAKARRGQSAYRPPNRVGVTFL